MGVKVVGLSLIDVGGPREATGSKVWAILGCPDWWNVDKFYTRELSGRIERTVVRVVGLQNGGSNVRDCPVVIVVRSRTSLWGGGL